VTLSVAQSVSIQIKDQFSNPVTVPQFAVLSIVGQGK
jgi:hypothetical protein